MRTERCAGALLALALAGCGGGGGASPAPPAVSPAAEALGAADVEGVIARAAAEATARNLPAHILVVDRAGIVLGHYRMHGAPATAVVSSGLGVSGGLEGVSIPAGDAATSKAITAAYLSSSGNAFSTRTAGQIVQEHFNPQEAGQPSGPLYGVQFSQLPCSDILLGAGGPGPRRSPLGLAADPGGLPLYRNGVLVGAIGVEADGRYGLDRDIVDIDASPEEGIALAGSFGFAAPRDIRAERITADGRTLRYVDSEALATDPANAPRLSAVAGDIVSAIRGGTAFGTIASGVAAFPELRVAAHTLAGPSGPRFPIRTSDNLQLGAPEVERLLQEAIGVAQRTRAQIRRPLGSAAQVNIAVVGVNGELLGFARSPDAPVFGIDVAVQKARTAVFFSLDDRFEGNLGAYGALAGSAARGYLDDARAFLGDGAEFSGATAWSTRAVGNLHRPFYPDGIRGAPRGPLSTPIERWSPFNTGLQLDLVLPALAGEAGASCVPGTVLRNGMQVFPGGLPVYRGGRLMGAIGVSGDGVDQDDMIAYLAIANNANVFGLGLGHPALERRADRHAPRGVRLRYVQCPQAPFVDSSEQGACAP